MHSISTPIPVPVLRTACLVSILALVLLPGLADVAVGDDCRTYVVDRIDADRAVLLVEDADRTVDQRTVPVDDLPAAARHEGAVLERVDGGYVYDETTTDRRLSRADDRFDRLSTSLDGGDGPGAGPDVRPEGDRSHHAASAGGSDGQAGADGGGEAGGGLFDLCRLRLGSFAPFGTCS